MFKNILVYLTMKQTQFNNEVTRFTLNTLQNFINIYIYTILYKNHIHICEPQQCKALTYGSTIPH